MRLPRGFRNPLRARIRASSCLWGNCYGKGTVPAALVTIQWSCGHRDEPVPTCGGCLKILHAGVGDPKPPSPCAQCGKRSPARIVLVVDLD